MDDLRFFDANVVVGRPRNQSVYKPLTSPDELNHLVAEHDLDGLLVWHLAQQEGHPETGNALLGTWLENCPAAVGTWAIMPPHADGIKAPKLFTGMRKHGIRALRIFPSEHRYIPRRVAFGALLDDVSERRIPLFISLARGMSWDATYALLEDYPNVTCILGDIGAWSADRYTYPLLDTYPNVHIETSLLALEDGGVEEVVSRFGAGRLVFGSGFPIHYMEASKLQLIHAEIDAGDKQAIASGNLRNLLSGANLL